MSKTTIVVFKQSWRGYSTGETAGFDEATADALVKAGKADLGTGKKAAAGKAASDKKPNAAGGTGPQDPVGPSGDPDPQQEEEKP